MTRRSAPLTRPIDADGVRGALLRTLPGRAIVDRRGGQARRSALLALASARSGPFVGVVDTVAALALVGRRRLLRRSRLLVARKRRLLWRVRRKLILSYIFIGFVPAMLIVAFFLLVRLLLFFELQLLSRAEPPACAHRAARASSRRARRSRSSAPAAATSRASWRAARRRGRDAISRRVARGRAGRRGACGGTPAPTRTSPALSRRARGRT